MRKTAGWLIALGLACSVLQSAVSAAPILDQQFDPANKDFTIAIGTTSEGLPNFTDAGQTFMVGITGTLTSVDVMVGRSGELIADSILFDIRTTTLGFPTVPNTGGNILASVSIPAGSIGVASVPTTFTSVDLTGLGVDVTAGDVLAIVLRSAGALPAHSWTGSSTNEYSDGSAYRRFSSTPWEVPSTGPPPGVSANDFAFRTFVEPSSSVVPEPTSLVGWSLLVCVGLTVGWSRRKKFA